MLSKPKDPSLKYHLVVEWPPSCRNRNVRTLKSRPDLVHRMNEHTKKIISMAEQYPGSVKLESEYNHLGIRVWFELGEDCYDFLMKQKQNNLKILPQLYILSGLNSVLNKFNLKIDEEGITVY